MLLAAEAAAKMATLDGEPLQLDEDTYALVMTALSSLKSDVRAVLAEHDILRGMVTGRFDTLFQTGDEHGRSSDVGGDQPQEAGDRGATERTDATKVSSDVRPSGSDGTDGSGPKPKRNRRKSRRNQGEVESAAGSSEVDRGTEAG
jgi:hypothetical protein